MTEFKEAFKKTSYYKDIFINHTVILMYIGGSRCVRIADDESDYDIVVVTLDGEYEDTGKYLKLNYKNTHVHWYYDPISLFFNLSEPNPHTNIGKMHLRHLASDLIIYYNPQYKKLISQLYTIKDGLSTIGMYLLYENCIEAVEKILEKNQLLPEYSNKFLYHLCLASYYLTNEKIDKDFITAMKRILTQPLSEKYKVKAVERLKVCKSYIESHPIDIKNTLQTLYKELMLYE
jgi:hypothetical protein